MRKTYSQNPENIAEGRRLKKRNGSQSDPPVAGDENVLSEENLRRIEAQPGFKEMMDAAVADERAGRVYTFAEVEEAWRKGTLKALMRKRRREWRQRG